MFRDRYPSISMAQDALRNSSSGRQARFAAAVPESYYTHEIFIKWFVRSSVGFLELITDWIPLHSKNCPTSVRKPNNTCWQHPHVSSEMFFYCDLNWTISCVYFRMKKSSLHTDFRCFDDRRSLWTLQHLEFLPALFLYPPNFFTSSLLTVRVCVTQLHIKAAYPIFSWYFSSNRKLSQGTTIKSAECR